MTGWFMGGCSTSDELIPEAEDATVEDNGEGLLVEGDKTYTLDWGWLEDWGNEYEGSRSYSIDLFSDDYKSYEREGVTIGIYFNSPSLTSFEEGTYSFKDPEHAPGGILAAGISIDKSGAWLTDGYIKVGKEGKIYTLTFEVTGEDVETGETRTFTGYFKGPLPLSI
jgi:hypothetical protein